jgi:type IV secretory pathway VirB6-like protein
MMLAMPNIYLTVTQQCSQLLTQKSGDIQAIGKSMTLSLGAILFAYDGIMMAIGGAAGKSMNTLKLAQNTFLFILTLGMIQFWSVPVSVGGSTPFTVTSMITDGTTYVTKKLVLNGPMDQMSDNIDQVMSGITPPSGFNWLQIISFFTTYIALILLQAFSVAIVAYGAIAAAVCILLGPLFVPFLLLPKLEWLFWGWLRAFIGFSFFKVVNAAVLYVIAGMFLKYSASVGNKWMDSSSQTASLPTLVICVLTCAYMITKIPAITSSILSGYVGGHSSIVGAAVEVAKTAASAAA